MKSINARTTLKLVLSFSWFIALALVRPGYAGEYYIYQDSNGKLVISNYAPPPGEQRHKEGNAFRSHRSADHRVPAP